MATVHTDGTLSDFNTKRAAASNGDTIIFDAGATWAAGANTITQALTIDFGGFTIARGATTATLLPITTSVAGSTWLKNGVFTNSTNGSSGNNRVITVGGGFARPKFRIQDCTFNSSNDSTIHVDINDSWGLIDGCTFYGNDGAEMVHNNGDGDNTTSNAGWNQTITPGTIDQLYIEDCDFWREDQANAFFWGCCGLQSYYGARTVVRHSRFHYCQIDQHGTGGNVGARWWEFYDVEFILPSNGGGQNQDKYIGIRAGSGVCYNITKSGGANGGSGSLLMEEEDSGGYPELWQVGRGKDSSFPPASGSQQALDPAYWWNNFKLPTGQATYIVDGRDYFSNTEKPGYTALTYPYPWGDTPTGITASVSGLVKLSGLAKLS